MDRLEEFKKILKEVMNKDTPPLNDKEFQQGVRELEAITLLEENWVVKLN